MTPPVNWVSSFTPFAALHMVPETITAILAKKKYRFASVKCSTFLSRFLQNHFPWLKKPYRIIEFSMLLDIHTPASRLMITPVSSVYPKLSIVPEPNIIKMPATAAVVIFPSRTEENALWYPLFIARFTELPFFNSSLILSLIMMLASTAMPPDSISPAMPGRVIVYCGTEMARICSAI